MLSELGNDLRKIVLAGIGAVAVTAEKSEQIVKEFVKKGELTVEQGKVLNEELKHKVQEAVQNCKSEPEPEKKPAVDVGTLSPEERAELRRRLEELEAKDADESEPAEG